MHAHKCELNGPDETISFSRWWSKKRRGKIVSNYNEDPKQQDLPRRIKN